MTVGRQRGSRPMVAGAGGRVVVVSASVGGGHDGVARELAQRLRAAGRTVDLVDALDLLPGRLGHLVCRLYRLQLTVAPRSWGWLLAALDTRALTAVGGGVARLAVRRLEEFLDADVVLAVSTYPMATQAFARARARGRLCAPLVVHLTDPSVHRLSISPHAALTVAPTEVAARQARRLGAGRTVVVPPLVATGFRPASGPVAMALGPRWVSPDARLVVVARALRTFGYGCTSVLLGQMLVEDGDPPVRIGMLLAVAATGSVVASILMGLYADRFGRRSSLLLSAGLMAMAGVVFEVSESYPLLLAAAFVGTVSPSTNDNTPFSGVEQAILAQTCPPERHTAVFARYGMSALLAGALGGLAAAGLGLQSVAEPGDLAFGIYATLAAATAILFGRLTPAAEPEPGPTAAPTGTGSVDGARPPGRVLGLAGLFAVDAFAGGLAVQAVLALWFQQRYGASTAELGLLFFATNLLSALSQALAPVLAARRGLLQTMLVPHFVSNVLLLCVPAAPDLGWAAALLAAPPRAVQDRRARPPSLHHGDRHPGAAGRSGQPDHRGPQRRRIGEPADVEPAARRAPTRQRGPGPAPAQRRTCHRLRRDDVVLLPCDPDRGRRSVVAPAARPPPRSPATAAPSRRSPRLREHAGPRPADAHLGDDRGHSRHSPGPPAGRRSRHRADAEPRGRPARSAEPCPTAARPPAALTGRSRPSHTCRAELVLRWRRRSRRWPASRFCLLLTRGG